MKPKDVDYSKYTAEELLDAKQGIDPSVAPENYEKLCAELELRKDEVKEHLEKKKEEFVFTTENRVKLLGYFQVAAAIILIFLFFL